MRDGNLLRLLQSTRGAAIVRSARMSLTPEQIRWIFVYLFVLIVSVAIHEFGHAFVATKLGDDTPRRQGRVTLNPLAHIDPIGTLFLPVMGAIVSAANGGAGGGFGWGKPVEWQPHKVKRGVSMTTARVLVSFAGPMMNLLLGTVIAIVHVVLLKHDVLVADGHPSSILLFAAATNYSLFFFNLLPFSPLDGRSWAEALTPYRYRAQYEAFAKFAPFFILAIIAIPELRFIVSVPTRFLIQHLYTFLLGIL